MNQERWHLMEDLFNQALERPLGERPAYLEQACAGDNAMLREVSALLRAEAHGAGFGCALEAAVAAVNSSSGSDCPLEMVGRRIGAYRVTGLIGRGGMGIVYRAVRDDDEYQKEVAVKLLGFGLCGADLQRRFRQERQILARLEHRNIARLLDGGATQDGRPYFVMEYVENGLPLDRFCREKSPSTCDRLKLFQQVCDAVDYAHCNLIVHRDLKPGHILIASGGIPKLLDFGIAKMLNPDPHEAPPDVTLIRILTPEYASPEQVRGEPVTTATDVYSLGMILYELLTDLRPYSVEGQCISEVERIISTQVPERPSDALARLAPSGTRKTISRKLSRDLDNIVLMALRKEPEQRYRSARQLADDIDRFLEGRPVMARQRTWHYRAAKFVRRNRTATCAAVVAGITLTAGIAATTYQMRQTDERFQQVRKLAHAVLFDFHDQIAPLPGSVSARLRLVQTGLEYLDSLARVTEDDDSLQLDLAAAYEKVSDAQGYPYGPNLGRYQEALQSRAKALRIYERLAQANSANAEASYRLSNARVRMAAIQMFLGDVDSDNRGLHQAAKAVYEALTTDPSQLRNYLLLGKIQAELGNAEMRAAKPAGALSYFRAAIENGSRSVAAQSPLESKRFMAGRRRALATALWDTGDFDGSLRELSEAVRLGEECADHPKSAYGDRMNLLVFRNALGSRLKDKANFQRRPPIEAIEELQKARVLSESLMSEDLSNAQARRNLVTTYRHLALALQAVDSAQAEEWIRKAFTLLEASRHSAQGAAELHGETLMYRALAEVLARRARHQEAVAALRTGLERQLRAAHLAPARADLRIEFHELHAQLGALLLETGDRNGALDQFRRSLAISESAFHLSPSANARRDVALSYENMGKYWAALGSWREACDWRRKSLEIWNRWSDDALAGPYSQARQREAQVAVASCESKLVRLQSVGR